LRALSAEIGAVQPWNSLAELRQALVAAVPHLAMIDEVPENTGPALPLGTLGAASFVYAVTDHFLTNPITRASALMADLSARAKAREKTRIAAE
jgi:NADH-quinone oxidoreductase subunit G